MARKSEKSPIVDMRRDGEIYVANVYSQLFAGTKQDCLTWLRVQAEFLSRETREQIRSFVKAVETIDW